MDLSTFPNILSPSPYEMNSVFWKAMDGIRFTRSYHGKSNITTDRVISIAVSLGEDSAEPCMFESPVPCPRCTVKEKCGGYTFKFCAYSLAPLLGARPVFVRSLGYGYHESNTSIIARLFRDEANISEPYISLDSDRNEHATPIFPLFISHYSAIVKLPSEFKENDELFQSIPDESMEILLLLLLLYLSLVVLRKISDQLPNSKINKLLHMIPDAVFWLFISVVLSYIGSVVTIELYKPIIRQYPFQDFREMAELMQARHFRPVIQYKLDLQRIFQIGKGKSKLLQTFNNIYNDKVVSPILVSNLSRIIELILNDNKNIPFVFLSSEMPVLEFIEQNYCSKLYIMYDAAKLMPASYTGFYISNKMSKDTGFSKLDWYKRHVLTNAYYAWVRWYLREPNKPHCSHEHQNEKRRGPLHLDQFYYLNIAFCILIAMCCGVLAFEVYTYRQRAKANRDKLIYNERMKSKGQSKEKQHHHIATDRKLALHLAGPIAMNEKQRHRMLRAVTEFERNSFPIRDEDLSIGCAKPFDIPRIRYSRETSIRRPDISGQTHTWYNRHSDDHAISVWSIT